MGLPEPQKVCRMMAFWAVVSGVGLLFCLPWGSGKGSGKLGIGFRVQGFGLRATSLQMTRRESTESETCLGIFIRTTRGSHSLIP